VTDFIRSRPLLSGIVALVVLFILFSAFPIVSETRQAVVVQFGKPTRILGATQAGLNYRIPFVENLVWIDSACSRWTWSASRSFPRTSGGSRSMHSLGTGSWTRC
jgi:hypothetical protein